MNVTVEVTDGRGSRIPRSQAEILSAATPGSKTLVTDDEGTAQLELQPGVMLAL